MYFSNGYRASSVTVLSCVALLFLLLCCSSHLWQRRTNQNGDLSLEGTAIANTDGVTDLNSPEFDTLLDKKTLEQLSKELMLDGWQLRTKSRTFENKTFRTEQSNVIRLLWIVLSEDEILPLVQETPFPLCNICALTYFAPILEKKEFASKSGEKVKILCSSKPLNKWDGCIKVSIKSEVKLGKRKRITVAFIQKIIQEIKDGKQINIWFTDDVDFIVFHRKE